MEKLAKEFKSGGYDFRQLKRRGNWALYERRRGAACNYEVIKIRKKKARNTKIAGRDVIFKGGEYYPATNEFGDAGWAFMELKNALEEYQIVTQRYPSV